MKTIPQRWMRPEDTKHILDFSSIPEQSIDIFLNLPRGIGRVVEIENKIVAFVFYEIKKTSIVLNHIAVKPEFRKQKIATTIISGLLKNLGKSRTIIKAEVCEYNLHAQLLFKKLGFKVSKVIRQRESDIYCFIYKLESSL